MKKELGDFQTPLPLVKEILCTIGLTNERWGRILEPTCGIGNFIRGILELGNLPKEIIGIELQDRYAEEAQSINLANSTRFSLMRRNIFDLDLGKDLEWNNKEPLLVIGNPPWVTNSALGVLNSSNLPRKSNLKGLRGIEAITGYSNFDIAEFIWIKLITELSRKDVTIALLCKTSVARNVLSYAREREIPISKVAIYKIDAKHWFKAAVDACLFKMELGGVNVNYEVDVFDSISAPIPSGRVGFVGKHLIADISGYKDVAFLEGKCPIEWRQGVKHDAASVMEVVWSDEGWRNKLGEAIEIEDDYIYPLIKGSDSYSSTPLFPRKAVIITQKKVGEDTRHLKLVAPRLWDYLIRHKDYFSVRKSSIYRGKMPFSIFGIGEYSFAPYKVIVSGLCKEPNFLAMGSIKGKPVMCDDTCYLLPLETATQASAIAAALNHPICKKFIKSITFLDSKRPITKKVLNRINLSELNSHLFKNEIQLPAIVPQRLAL